LFFSENYRNKFDKMSESTTTKKEDGKDEKLSIKIDQVKIEKMVKSCNDLQIEKDRLQKEIYYIEFQRGRLLDGIAASHGIICQDCNSRGIISLLKQNVCEVCVIYLVG
jgi:hypothetical protein